MESKEIVLSLYPDARAINCNAGPTEEDGTFCVIVTGSDDRKSTLWDGETEDEAWRGFANAIKELLRLFAE